MLRIQGNSEIEVINMVSDGFSGLPALSGSLEGFFISTEQASLLRIQDLILTRMRLDGIRNAIKKMNLAAQGKLPKRRPVSVRRLNGDILVIDGNSTVVALYLNAFDNVIASFES